MLYRIKTVFQTTCTKKSVTGKAKGVTACHQFVTAKDKPRAVLGFKDDVTGNTEMGVCLTYSKLDTVGIQ